jgi:hypothetical protein
MHSFFHNLFEVNNHSEIFNSSDHIVNDVYSHEFNILGYSNIQIYETGHQHLMSKRKFFYYIFFINLVGY